MNKLLTLFLILISPASFTQNQEKYAEYIKEAWNLYEAKEYQKSAEKYKEAFDQLEGKAYANDRYNAACSYALANDVENSFYHLFYLAENPQTKYKNYQHITTNSDLKLLYTDERWKKLIAIVKANKDEYEKDLDKPLVAQLDTIYQLDQSYRKQIGEIEEKFGRDSDEMKAHWRLIQETDSLNLIKIEQILDERGWLGADVIGDRGNMTLFLIIQHADLETQINYLPMMREAVTKGNAQASSLALLEDRVALRQGKPQIYGSQIGRDAETGDYFVSSLIEPEKVNERRAEVGLGPIEDYISRWNIVWDVEEHKERTSSQYSFDWLIGNWIRTNEQEGKITFETWEKESDSEYKGFSYTLQNNDTIWQENVQLIKSDEGWSYDVRDKGGTKPTKFKLTTIEKTGFICETQANEFPKFIEYNGKEENLQAKIWGDGMEILFEFEKLKD